LRIVDDASLAGPINMTSPNPVTSEVIATVIGRVLSRPSAFRVPEAALRLRFGEGADPLVTGRRALPGVLARAGFAWKYPDVEAAVREALG
jgi:NAD dependent epimerase/dehydratase family enzyme